MQGACGGLDTELPVPVWYQEVHVGLVAFGKHVQTVIGQAIYKAFKFFPSCLRQVFSECLLCSKRCIWYQGPVLHPHEVHTGHILASSSEPSQLKAQGCYVQLYRVRTAQ